MIIRLKPSWQQTILLLFMIIVTFVGYSFTNNDFFASSIWPSVGFAAALYAIRGNKVLLMLGLGIFTGNMLARTLMFNEEIYLAFIYSTFFTLVNLLQAYIFNFFYKRIYKFNVISIKNSLLIGIAIFIVSSSGALLSVTLLSIFNNFNTYFIDLTKWIIGDFLGITIFSFVTILSFKFDTNIKRSEFKNAILFLLIFMVIGYLLLRGTYTSFHYFDFAYIFIIFFFISAFIFPYRMIITISLLFLILTAWVPIESLFSDDEGLHMFTLHFYLLVMTNIAIITKMILTNYQDRTKELLHSNIQLEKLIESTNNLFGIADIELTSLDSNIKYLQSIFRIALTLHDNFDMASCYIKVEDGPLFIDAHNYNLDVLNSLDFEGEFDWAMKAPVHEKRIAGKLNITISEKDRLNLTPLKESIRFGIYIDDKVSGGMSFDITSDSEKNFSKNDLKSIKSFQRLMNSLYENNYSSNKRQNFKNGIVMSLIKTLELYDQYTGGHSEHVANISKELATKLHLTEKEIGEIYWAGVVHDIGKVGIDSSIINKKGKLTEEEYEIVKKHSSHGAAILDESDDLRDIAEIVKHHHEWWNGKGYPDGLIGDDIPFSSQILTVADAVSAMMDKRPYSRAKTKSEIIEEIAKNSGIMFNPKIAVLMIELLKGGIVDKIKKAQ